MATGVLMLAAGSGRRFGSDKRLATLPHGQTLLDTAVNNALDSGLPVQVCLAPNDNAIADQLRTRGCRVTLCQQSAQGMGATLANGVLSISDWDGVLIALADMPWILPDSFRTVADSLAADAIRIPVYEGRQGHPVGFGRHFYPRLLQLSGDRGAREVIQNHQQNVEEVALSDPGITRDVDTPGQLENAGTRRN